MNEHGGFDDIVAAARTVVDDPARNKVVRGIDGEIPRFELFHTALSICSQKVRTVLAEKNHSYTSHELTTPTMAGIGGGAQIADNYRPGYVRLRIFAAGAALMGDLANGHTLRTSTKSEGFDACVVPTLVDHEKRCAIVDSYEICAYLDRETPEAGRLVPEDADRAAEVMAQVRIVDGIPHPGQLYAFHPDDPRPEFLKKAMADIYDRKCAMLEQMIAENEDDPQLVGAYRAKINRERGGKKIQRDPEFLAGIRAEFEALIAALDAQIEKSGGPWVCGSDFTLADCVWGVSLYRMHWLGHAYLWKDRPRVHDYAHRTYKRPSIWNDTIHWPAPVPPSPHTADIL